MSASARLLSLIPAHFTHQRPLRRVHRPDRQPRQAHQRHTRKYAEGRLGEDKSFYFKGPKGDLNLRAFNLASFLEMARGVDDATFLFHLARGDYTRWFREAIKDDDLAADAQTLESVTDGKAARQQLADMVTQRYAAADVK